MEEILTQYVECLERYFQILKELTKMPQAFNDQMETINNETLEALTQVSVELSTDLTPSLKEK